MVSFSTTFIFSLVSVIAITTLVTADHGRHHNNYYAKPYYNYEYGVEAYGLGYGGHGDPGPLPYKHAEQRDGHETKVRREGGRRSS